MCLHKLFLSKINVNIQLTLGKYLSCSHCREKAAKPHATDPERAERLWKISAELVGLETQTQ